jgi:hypothetical protein
MIPSLPSVILATGPILWTWTWAGECGEHVTLEQGRNGPLISRLADLSANGNDLEPRAFHVPGYRVGLTLADGWTTDYPLIAINRYPDGQDHYGNTYFQERSLQGWNFYVAVAFTNSRTSGLRGLLGTTLEDNVQIDQDHNAVEITIAGNTYKTAWGSLPAGAVLLEIARSISGEVLVFANGVQIGQSPPNFDRWDLSGTGHGLTSNSHFDDYLLELVMFRGLPDQAFRQVVRDYFRSKWDLF